MDLDELRTVRRTEREKDSLQHLRDSFYEDVAAYLADLEARRDRAAAEAEDPFASQEVRKLTDKIETAEEVSEAIYERRVGKIVKQASFAAADMSADREGLTEQETALFDDLVDRIKQNKTTVLDILAGESDPASGDAETAAEPSVAPGAPDRGPTGVPEKDPSSPVESPPAVGEAEHQTDPIPAGDAPGAEAEPTADTPESAADSGGMLADAMGGDNAPEQDARERDSTGPASAESATEDPVPPSATGDANPEVVPDAAATAADGDVGAAGTDSTDAMADSTDAMADSTRMTAEDDHDLNDDADADQRPTTDGGATHLERTTVRITREVGSILGVDEREYDLEREDVVTLPATNADPLVERDAAERLE